MSIKVMTAVWAVDLPHADKLVLLALADNANDEGMCYPSVTTLAKKCGMDRSTILRAIGRLEAAAHLSRDQRSGRSTVYHVHPSHCATSGVVRLVAESDPTRRAAPPPPVALCDPTRRAAPPITIIEPSIEPSGNRKRGARTDARAAVARRIAEDFLLTEARRIIAEKEGIDAEREFAKFTDYWRAASGANARKHDWDATWRNWCRKASDMRSRGGIGTPEKRPYRDAPTTAELEALEAQRAGK